MTEMHRKRVEDQIRRVLSELMQRRLKDPRLGMVSVSRVELTPDLRYGRAYLVVCDDENDAEERLAVVKKAAGFLRTELGRVMRLRHTPEIRYHLDDSARAQARIEELLREASAGDEESEAGEV